MYNLLIAATSYTGSVTSKFQLFQQSILCYKKLLHRQTSNGMKPAGIENVNLGLKIFKTWTFQNSGFKP